MNSNNSEIHVKSQNRNRLHLYIILFWIVVFFLTASGKLFTTDSITAAATARAMLHGKITINEPTLVTLEDKNGNNVYRHELFWPVIIIPFDMAALVIEKIITPESASQYFPDQVHGVILPFANYLITSLILLIIFRWLTASGISAKLSFSLTLCAGLGTMLLPYSRDLFRQCFSALMLLLALKELYFLRHDNCKRVSLLTGIWLFLALSNRIDTMAWLPVYFFGMISRIIPLKDKKIIIKCIIYFSLPVIAGIAGYYYTVWLRWGDIFFNPGYGNNFPTSLMESVPSFFLSPERGFISYFPQFIFIYWALRNLWTAGEKWLACMISSITILFLLIYGKYIHYYGGVNPGPRYMLPLIPIWFISFGMLLEKEKSNKTFLVVWIVISAWGALINIYEILTDYTKYRSAGTMLMHVICPSLDDGLPAWNIEHILQNYWITLIRNLHTRIAGIIGILILLSAAIFLFIRIWKNLKIENEK